MNVTLKLPDELCRKAKHLAVEKHKSLSAWTAELIDREVSLSERPKTPPSLMELFGHPLTEDLDFPMEDRKAGKVREFSFED